MSGSASYVLCVYIELYSPTAQLPSTCWSIPLSHTCTQDQKAWVEHSTQWIERNHLNAHTVSACTSLIDYMSYHQLSDLFNINFTRPVRNRPSK